MKTKKIFAIVTAAAFLALLWVASGFETARPRTPAEAAPPGGGHNVIPPRAGSKGVGAFPPKGEVEIQSLMGTAFTYQGRLMDGGNPANGEYDFEFKLYDTASDGTQIGSTVTKEDVTVTDGLFTVKLDFGSGAFNGDARWLEIGVRPGASTGAYTTLDSRQELTPAPYALALPGLWTEQNPTSPNLIGGYSGNWVTSGVKGATIGGGGESGHTNRVTDDYGTVGGGYSNRAGDADADTTDAAYATVGGGKDNNASGWYATVGGGYYNTASGSEATVGGGVYNTASSTSATVGGGSHNYASYWAATVGGGAYNIASGLAATVGGGRGNVATASYATVGGGYYNEAKASYATIAGGGPSDPNNPWTTNNRIYDNYGTIGGGGYNRAGSDDGDTTTATYATIGGGSSNTASHWFATVGGGRRNKASGSDATVGGGVDNTASYYAATVGGGTSNTASGSHATVPGGYAAEASLYGQMAYASGRFANTGDAQFSLYIMRREGTFTTGNWFDLYLDGVDDLLTIPPGRTLTFDILVVRRSQGGKSAGYKIYGVIENVVGTTSLITSTVTLIGADDNTWGAQVGADDTNDALLVQVKGAGENIRWVAVVRTAEVSW